MSVQTARRGTWELFLAFDVGLGAMAVEMIASRLLTPFFGASFFVWTSLILTILVALAVGYWLGGIMAERGVDDAFIGWLLIAVGGLLAAGIWISGGFSASLVSVVASFPNAAIALFLGSLTAAAVIFALPVMVMGALGPILMKRLAVGGDVGRASGRYLFYSTLGSVAGTLLPALVLIPNIGSRFSLELVALMFAGLGLAALPRSKKIAAAVLILPLLGLNAVWTPAAGPELYKHESPYQLIRVTEAAGRRYLIYNEGAGIQSVYDPGSDRRTGMYYDYFGLLPLLRPFRSGDHRVAVIGLAGGAAVRRYPSFLPPGQAIDFVGVEIDGSVIDAARRWLGLDDLPVRVVDQDGRDFLRSTPDRFDSIIVDAYSNQLYIPAHLATGEFFRLVRERLNPGGVMAMNINVNGTDSALFRSLTAAVAGQFADVVALPVRDHYNYIVLASDEPLDLAALAGRLPPGYEDIQVGLLDAVRVRPDAAVRPLTDDWAPVEYMTESMIVAEAFKLGRGLKE